MKFNNYQSFKNLIGACNKDGFRKNRERTVTVPVLKRITTTKT
jgi:hypothetical protein